MGGHGGLNILPQKRWNVYNYENREKVRKDEAEQAAREQALAEEQRRRDSELRLQTLRARSRQQHLPPPQQQAAEERLLPPLDQAAQPSAEGAAVVADSSRLSESLDVSTRDSVSQAGALKSGHINLFEGLDSADFSALACGAGAQASDAVRLGRAQEVWEKEHKAGEEEKHRLGYGAVGKGGQQPWYARAGDLTVGEGEGGAGKIKGDAGSRGVGKRRHVESAEAKTDSQRVAFQAPQKSDSERVKRVGPGEEIHPAKNEDRDDTGDGDDEDISSPRHKKKRKHRRRRSASPDSSSRASGDDDSNHRRCRHRRSRKHREKERVKAKISSADRSFSKSPSSSSSDRDSDRGVRKKKQRSRRRSDSSSSSSLASSDDDDNRHHHLHRRRRSRKKQGSRRRSDSPDSSSSSSLASSDDDDNRHRHRRSSKHLKKQEHVVGERQGRETRRGKGRGRKARSEKGTERRKGKEGGGVTEEGMRSELKGAAAEQGKKSIEALRAERVAREARERERAQMLLLQHHQTSGGRGLGGVSGSAAAGAGNTSGVRELGGGVEGNVLFGGIVMHGPEAGQRRKEARYNSGFGYGR